MKYPRSFDDVAGWTSLALNFVFVFPSFVGLLTAVILALRILPPLILLGNNQRTFGTELKLVELGALVRLIVDHTQLVYFLLLDFFALDTGNL